MNVQDVFKIVTKDRVVVLHAETSRKNGMTFCFLTLRFRGKRVLKTRVRILPRKYSIDIMNIVKPIECVLKPKNSDIFEKCLLNHEFF